MEDFVNIAPLPAIMEEFVVNIAPLPAKTERQQYPQQWKHDFLVEQQASGLSLELFLNKYNEKYRPGDASIPFETVKKWKLCELATTVHLRGSLKRKEFTRTKTGALLKNTLVDYISVANGLFNGAMGTVYGFVYASSGPTTPEQYVPTVFSTLEDDEREIPIVLVQMDGTDETFPYSCSSTVKRLVPITAVTGGTIKSHYHRMQLPLLPAHARTAHSVQGFTAPDGIVVDTGSMFFAGDYVAISRATDIDKVMLLNPALASFFTSHPEYRLQVLCEYARLASKATNCNC